MSARRRGPRAGDANPEPLEKLSVELTALALRAIRGEHQHFNLCLFGGQLKCPRFTAGDGRTRLGQWDGESATLEISRILLLTHSWGDLVEVLKHEMAHQFVDEVLGIHDQRSHGPAFRHVCTQRGIDARANGLPEQSIEVTSEEGVALSKISGLLSLAGSANENEAQAAMNAAQRLMLRYNLQASRVNGSSSAKARLCFRQLGTPSGRVFEPARILALILDEHFFVEGIWVPVWRPAIGKKGHVLEICGKLTNVEIAEYAFDFLNQTAERLWCEHKQRAQIRSNRDRRVFLAGVMSGFHEKLNRQKQKHAGHGLVWLGDPTVSAYFKQRHPRARMTRTSSSQNAPAHAAGKAAGNKIVLHRAVTSQDSSRGRQLGAG